VRFLSLGIAIMFALTVLAASKHVSAQSSSEHDKQELERLEKVWNEAHEHADADVLQSLWADDLEVDVPKMPVMRKTEVMAFARSGRMKFLRYATSDINIRVYGDAAVVTGRLQRTRTLNGLELSDDWRFTKVYTRHAQMWRVVSFHASEAAKPN
jgi:ketosteroid isomerase-like protein